MLSTRNGLHMITDIPVSQIFNKLCILSGSSLSPEQSSACKPTDPSQAASLPSGIPPSFVQKLANKHLVEGSKLVLECLANGVPFPMIEFTHNSKPIFEGQR